MQGRKAEHIRTKEAQQDQRDTQYYIPTRKPKEDWQDPHPLLEKNVPLWVKVILVFLASIFPVPSLGLGM